MKYKIINLNKYKRIKSKIIIKQSNKRLFKIISLNNILCKPQKVYN